LRAAIFGGEADPRERQLSADTVEKLRITMTRKLIGIFCPPGARIAGQLCGSESHQAGFSCDFYYPLVYTVRNVAQIANKIVALFKTEFFNRIGRLFPFPTLLVVQIHGIDFVSGHSWLDVIAQTVLFQSLQRQYAPASRWAHDQYLINLGNTVNPKFELGNV